MTPPLSIPLTLTLMDKFWDVVDKYDRLVDRYRLGTPKLRPILEQLSLIDSDHIQRVGEECWGVGGGHTGLPGELADELPIKIEAAVGKAAERWEGDAFDAYRTWMTDLQGILGKLTEPAQQVGQALVELAEAFRITVIEIIGAIVTVAGLIVALAALAVPEPIVSKALAAIVAAVSLGLAAATVQITTIASVKPRFRAAHDAADALNGELQNKMPTAPDTSIPTPNRADWKAKTPDPSY